MLPIRVRAERTLRTTDAAGTRALGVYGQRWAEAPAGPVCLALWGVNDPGNVGTALRSALAFGAGSVALGPGSADPYGHKAVRASMGAIFEVPVVRYANMPGAFAWWLVARQLGKTPTDRAAAGAYDRLVVPVTRKLESRYEPPLGQSIFCVGRRPSAG